MFNANKLRGKIAEARVSITSLAAKIGMNASTFHRKLSGDSDFTRSEIQNISAELCLSKSEVVDIFFG